MPVADLSQNAAKARTPEAADLGQDNNAQAEVPEQAAPEVIHVLTAFMVVITEDGQVGLIADINSPVVPSREASGDEIFGALHTAAFKLSSASVAGQSATNVVNAMQSAGQQMAKAQQEAALNARVQWEMANPGKRYPGTPAPAGFNPRG
jgi:hypothetical protein